MAENNDNDDRRVLFEVHSMYVYYVTGRKESVHGSILDQSPKKKFKIKYKMKKRIEKIFFEKKKLEIYVQTSPPSKGKGSY